MHPLRYSKPLFQKYQYFPTEYNVCDTIRSAGNCGWDDRSYLQRRELVRVMIEQAVCLQNLLIVEPTPLSWRRKTFLWLVAYNLREFTRIFDVMYPEYATIL